MKMKKRIAALLVIIIIITNMPLNAAFASSSFNSIETASLSESVDSETETSENVSSQTDVTRERHDTEVIESEQTEKQQEESALDENQKAEDVQQHEDESSLEAKGATPFGAGDAWKVTSGHTSLAEGDTTIYTSTINLSRDPNNTTNLYKEYEVLIRADYFPNKSNINLVAPTVQLKDGSSVPTFVITDMNQTVTIDGVQYYKYTAAYNNLLEHPIAGYDEVLTTTTITITLNVKTEEITENIKTPIIVQDEEEVLIETGDIEKPEPEDGLSVDKDIASVYQVKDDGKYEKYQDSIVKPFKVHPDDIVEYKITLKNGSSKKIENIELYEDLPVGLLFINGSFQLKNGTQVTNVNNKWSAVVSEKGQYQYNELITLAAGGTITISFYAKVNSDSSTLDKLVNHVSAYVEEDKQEDWEGSLTGEDVYDLQLITGFTKLNGNVNKGLTPQKAENDPYKVVTGDELTMTIMLRNNAVMPTKNIEVAVYLPSALTIKGSPATITSYPYAGAVPAGAAWNGLTIYKITSAHSPALANTLAAGGEFTIEIPIVVGNIDNLTEINELYAAAEIIDFEDANDSNLNIRNHTIEDVDSTPDLDPYNDLFKNGIYTEISSGLKEIDNAWNGNGKNTSDQDEDDYDFAFVIKDDNPTDPAKYISKTRASKTLAESFLNELSDTANPYSPHISFDPSLTALSDDGKITGTNNYMLYTLVVNKDSRQTINDDITITDILPEGLQLLSGTSGGVERYAISYRSTVSGTGVVYDNGIMDTLVVTNNGREFTLTIRELQAGTGNFFHDSQEFTIKFLVRVDPAEAQEGQVYKNSVTMEFGRNEVVTNEETSSEWGNIISSASAKKMVYDKEKDQYVDSTSINVIEPNETEIKYRLIFTSRGFVPISQIITDELKKSSNIDSIDVEILGYNGSLGSSGQIENLVPIASDKLAFSYTIEPDNSKVTFVQDKGIPAYQVYHLDLTVKYNTIDFGEVITNALATDKVTSLKPLNITLDKKNSDGEQLLGSQFTAYYSSNTWVTNLAKPLINTAGNAIVLKPGTTENTAHFVPEDYKTKSEWFIILKETQAPSGYEENLNKEYKIHVTKDSNGDLTYTLESDVADGNLTNGIITLINEPNPTVIAKIKKVDQDGANINATVTFEIYALKADGSRDHLIKTITTSNGISSEYTLEKGKYELVEKAVPSGYVQSSPARIFFTVKDVAGNLTVTMDVHTDNSNVVLSSGLDNKFTFTATNTLLKVPFELTKHDQDGTALAGAIFTLTNSAGIDVTATSTATGKVMFSDLVVGSYTLTETTAPNGYSGSAKTWNVVVNNDGAVTVKETGKTEAISNLVVVNEQITADFELTKHDQDGNVLAGATFTLTNSAGIDVTATSTATGKVTFSDLLIGSYTLAETAAPTGYTGSAKTWNVVVNNDGTVTVKETGKTEEISNLVVVNEEITADFELTKHDQDGNALAGAIFNLTNSTGVDVTATSTATGKVTFSDLLIGNYTLTETAAPTGYTGSAKTWNVVVNNDGTVTVKETGKTEEISNLEVVNEQITADFELTKHDQDGNVLAGATFTLTNSVGVDVTATSTATGKVTFSDLLIGSYTLAETAAPTGYTGSNETWSVEVGNDGTVTVTETGKTEIILELVVVNDRIPTVVDKTTHTVEKVWDDHDNQAKVRPTSIKVQLIANGTQLGEVVILSADNNWTYKWDDLEISAGAETIIYTVEELELSKAYKKSEVTQGSVTTITNTYIPERVTETEVETETKKKEMYWTAEKMDPSFHRTEIIRTGDETNLMFISLILLSSLTAIGVLIISKRKDHKNK